MLGAMAEYFEIPVSFQPPKNPPLSQVQLAYVLSGVPQDLISFNFVVYAGY